MRIKPTAVGGIRSRPATKEFYKGWELAFGDKKKEDKRKKK